jgi:hypothetical protein
MDIPYYGKPYRTRQRRWHAPLLAGKPSQRLLACRAKIKPMFRF